MNILNPLRLAWHSRIAAIYANVLWIVRIEKIGNFGPCFLNAACALDISDEKPKFMTRSNGKLVDLKAFALQAELEIQQTTKKSQVLIVE